jgi:hypothetical protein
VVCFCFICHIEDMLRFRIFLSIERAGTKGHFTHKPRAVTTEIVRAQKKVSKGRRPNTPPKSCSVVMDPQVWC